MLERLRLAHRSVHPVEATDDEHLAALEVLLLVAMADGTVTSAELDRVRDEVEQGAWESPTFSYHSRFGLAMAKVRSMDDGARAHFVAGAADRIVDDALRREVVRASAAIAAVDGGAEPAIVGAVRTALDR